MTTIRGSNHKSHSLKMKVEMFIAATNDDLEQKKIEINCIEKINETVKTPRKCFSMSFNPTKLRATWSVKRPSLVKRPLAHRRDHH